MKKLLVLAFLFAGCQNSTESVWDETSTAGNYINKAKSFFSRPYGESRAIKSEEDFMGPREDEFIPLSDRDLRAGSQEVTYAQPKEEPGSKISKLPGIEGFKTPTGNLATVFQKVYFNTDDHILRTRDYLDTIVRIANYMKKDPNLYLFVAGHTDERASEAYNLALGTRRSNWVRTEIIKQGVNPGRVFSISYGKEMPADPGHTREAWSKNRRCEFKVYENPTIVKR